MARRRKPRRNRYGEFVSSGGMKRNPSGKKSGHKKGAKKGAAKPRKRAAARRGHGKHLAKANAHLAKAVLEMSLHESAQRTGHEGGEVTAGHRPSRGQKKAYKRRAKRK